MQGRMGAGESVVHVWVSGSACRGHWVGRSEGSYIRYMYSGERLHAISHATPVCMSSLRQHARSLVSSQHSLCRTKRIQKQTIEPRVRAGIIVENDSFLNSVKSFLPLLRFVRLPVVNC